MLARFSQTEQKWIAAVALVTAVLVVGLGTPQHADNFDVDHDAHAYTLELLAGGVPYHQAMHEAMVVRDGGPSGSARSFRLPTMFWIWSVLPDAYWSLLAAIVVVGMALIWLLPHRPLVVPVLGLYLAVNAFPNLVDRGWHGQWLTVELWAVQVALLAIAFWWRRRDRAAAGAATLSAFMREHLLLLLVGGALAAWRQRRPVWPWLTGLGLFAAFYAWHTWQASPFVVDVGYEQPLFLDGGLRSVGAMSGFGLPAAVLVGPVLMLVALWRTRRDWMPLPLLTLPLGGLFVLRSYWGLMVVPVAILVAVAVPSKPPNPQQADLDTRIQRDK